MFNARMGCPPHIVLGQRVPSERTDLHGPRSGGQANRMSTLSKKNMTYGPVNSLYGIVLCGGKSSRVGSDKGLLQSGAGRWSETGEAAFICSCILLPTTQLSNCCPKNPIDTIVQLRRIKKPAGLLPPAGLRCS